MHKQFNISMLILSGKTKLLVGIMLLYTGAGVWAQNVNIAFKSKYAFSSGVTCSNICGYVDSIGNEYALVGKSNGVSIIKVTNPTSPGSVAYIPGTTSQWREIKVRGKYAYVANEGGGGLQIINLSSFPGAISYQNWMPPPTISFTKIHSLHIDNNYLYLYGSNVMGGAALILDLTDPWNPTYVGVYNNISSPYVHDGYVRNDTLYACHVYQGFFSIVDCTDKANPIEIGSQSTPGNLTHNSWLSTNSHVLYTTDEVNNGYLTSYDISNPANISELDRIQSRPGSNSTPHNTHIINVSGNDYAVSSWYLDGVTIVDAGRPNNLVQVGNYDTESLFSGGGMDGAWGVYPYLPSGNLIVSDIHNGLFVLSPTYTRASYLEGIITDSVTGLPINRANVEMLNTSVKDSSKITGDYAVGIATAGSYDVKYSKAGYYSKIISGTVLSSGIVNNQNIQLVPLSPLTITGQVVEAGTSIPIPDARVELKSFDFDYFITTDANGNFSIPANSDLYEINSSKWGYELTIIHNSAINALSAPLIIGLNKNYYDDFTLDLGWIKNGTATQGKWERGSPILTGTIAIPFNPGIDDSTDFYSNAYVTGNGGGSMAHDDIANGYTILTSPVFDLSGYVDPHLDYSRWFYGNGTTNADSLVIYLNNGISEVQLEYAVASTPLNSTWQQKSFRIADYLVPTSSMKLRVYAADVGSNNIVEAGFDKFMIWDMPLSISENNLQKSLMEVYPIPATESITLDTKNCIADNIIILDLRGQIVMRIKPEHYIEKIDLSGISKGMYFIEVTIMNHKEVKKFIKN